MSEIKRISKNEVKRISPQEVKARLGAGDTLLVCAYDDEERCRQLRLEGAITLHELESRLPSVPKSQEVIFYCAWPEEATAAGRAVQYLGKGYEKIVVLGGGVEAWRKAGYSIIGEREAA